MQPARNLGSDNLVMLSDQQSPAAEAYRSLCTNIQFSSLNKPLQTLLVATSRPFENKVLTVANLAITFARLGKSVILVDADLRRPALHSLFGVSNNQGLTTLILDLAKSSRDNILNGPLFLAPTTVENLRILPSGPLAANSAEVLGTKSLDDLISRLKKEADYILFDAPPLLTLTDGVLLASKMDGTILVIKAGKTTRDEARQAKEQLEKVRANLLGVVLTEVKLSRNKYRY